MNTTRWRYVMPVLVCSGLLLGACAATSPVEVSTPTHSSPDTNATMNPSNFGQKDFVGKFVEALKSERMLDAGFYEDASLQAWFAPVQRTARPNPINNKALSERLIFGDSDVKLELSRLVTGKSVRFSVDSARSRGLLQVRVDDLIATLGEPQHKLDFVADQIRNAPRAQDLPSTPPGAIVSPQPIRTRGENTHPLGNHDVSWHWQTPTSRVELKAEINGDGSVSILSGRQEAL